jgi:hypothetical protein
LLKFGFFRKWRHFVTQFGINQGIHSTLFCRLFNPPVLDSAVPLPCQHFQTEYT